MANHWEVKEGIQYQTDDEAISWSIIMPSWVTNPQNITATAFNKTIAKDVTETAFPTNIPTFGSGKITLSPLQNLDGGHDYQLDVIFNEGANTYEFALYIHCWN